MDAPIDKFMGQIEQESACLTDVTSRVGAEGLCQFMPKTAQWIHDQEPSLQELFKEPMPYDAKWSIRAMVLYNKWLYERTSCLGWYYAFRGYNGGLGNINREINNANSCEVNLIEEQCFHYRSKSNCRENINYPYKIFEKAKKYK